MTTDQIRILQLADLVRKHNRWTTYGTVGEVVYGHRHGAQTVGNTMRDHGNAGSAHLILLAGGRMSPDFRGAVGGAKDAIRLLTRDGVWDDSRRRARKDRFIDAEELRRLATG
jgi:hypothetical protein